MFSASKDSGSDDEYSDANEYSLNNIPTKLSYALKQLKLNTKEDGEKIANDIRDTVILETLELRGNTLGVEATYPIADALESRPELRYAKWSDLFTGRLKEEIPKTLKLLCDAMTLCGARLVELDLSDNAIGPMAMPGICEYLASEDACELKTLNLNNCGLGIAGVTIAECLMECHRKSSEFGTPLKLRTFIAGRNRLEFKSTTALANAFKQIGTLEEIVMPQNGINADGIINLSEAVKANTLLKYINFNDNTFGERGAVAMAKALSNLSFLEKVDFGDCLCRSRGSTLILNELVSSQSKLKQLNLSGNEIDHNTARTIISLAQKIEGLENLNLSLNSFGAEWASLEQEAQVIPFLDVGNESDDQGSLSSEEEGEIVDGNSSDDNSDKNNS